MSSTVGRQPQRVLAHQDVRRESFRWGPWWHLLLPEEREVYTYLRSCSFNGTRSGLFKLEHAAKCNRRRYLAIFNHLEGCGLISCHQWGKVIPMLVVVHDIPPQPPMLEAVSMEARVLRAGKTDGGEVAIFLTWFANEWEQRKGDRYRILRGKDHGIIARLLKTYSVEDLQHYALHFFRLFEGPHTLGTFSVRINDVVASYSQTKKAML